MNFVRQQTVACDGGWGVSHRVLDSSEGGKPLFLKVGVLEREKGKKWKKKKLFEFYRSSKMLCLRRRRKRKKREGKSYWPGSAPRAANWL